MTQIEPIYSLKGKRVWVAGHRGMVGSALMRRLAQCDCTLLTVSRERLDLTRQAEVEAWMKETRPQAVFLAAAKVGGIRANDSRSYQGRTLTREEERALIAVQENELLAK